jgi:hypothetical protein
MRVAAALLPVDTLERAPADAIDPALAAPSALDEISVMPLVRPAPLDVPPLTRVVVVAETFENHPLAAPLHVAPLVLEKPSLEAEIPLLKLDPAEKPAPKVKVR